MTVVHTSSPPRPRRSTRLFVALVLLLMTISAACSGGGSSAKPKPTSTTTTLPLPDRLAPARDFLAPAELEATALNRLIVVRPPRWRPNANKTGVIFLHGYGIDATQAVTTSPGGRATRIALITKQLALAGVPVVSVNAAGNAWANNNALVEFQVGLDYLHHVVGTRPDRVLILAFSMGAQLGMVWASGHLKDVSGMVGIVPLSDFQDIYDNNRSGLRPSIDLAYKQSPVAPAMIASRNPLALARSGKLAGLQLAAFYGDQDTVVLPDTVKALAAAIGPSASATALPGTHESIGPAIPIDEVVQYLVSRS